MSPAPWVPTHTVPAGGLETFLYGAPAAPLDPGLPVQAAEWADGWARIVCENGWEAWVDGARLLPVAAAPAASAPVAPALAAPAPATPASYPAAAPPPITAAPVGPAPYPAQAAPLAYATPAPRRRRPRRLLFLGVGALVLLIAFGGVFGASRLLAGGNRPAVADNLFADPTAAAGQLTAGLDKPMPVPRQDVRGLFETYPPVPPGNVLPPPLDEDGPPRSSLPVAADADTVDVQVAGTVPDDFKAFIAAASAGGVADYDKLYADADFNFTNEARASRIPVLITTDRAPFTALANVQQFRSGFVDPCFNHAADAAGCEPRVMILFDPAQWKGGDYPPMSRPRVEHELFHVAHQKLLKKLRLGNLFQAPGYFWQTEGFATFTQRQVPDFEAYQSFPANILNQGFFSWPKITDGRYESAYEASSFLDEMVFQSGNDPKLLTRWIKATRAGDPSSLSLMSTIAGSGESIDIDRFQELYVRSITDFYAPGFLPKIDGRTVGVAVPDAYKAEKTVAEKDFTPAATPVSVDAAMAPLSSRLFRVGVAGLPKEDSAKVRLSLSADRADGLRGVVLVLRGDNDKNLPFCYRQIGDSPPDAMAAGATRCFKDNARVAGVIGAGGGKVDVTVGSLKKFSPDVSKLSFVVVGFNLLTSVSAGLTPAKARLTVSQPFGNLDLTLSGSITGHAFAEQDFNPDCKLDNRGGIGLTVSWLKVHLGDQTITFDFSIYPWPGPGRHKVYTEIDNASIGTVSSNSWYENEKPESFAVFAPDKQTVTFDTNMTTYGKPTDPKVHATGTFVCAKPIA